MPTPTYIADHEARALARLLSQYRGKPNIEGMIKALGTTQIQQLEDIFYPMINRLDIATQVGEQLDRIGVIVNQQRLGLDDARYRVLLFAKIGINVSEGEPKSIISVFKLLTAATLVHYMNLGNGEVELASNGMFNPFLSSFVLENLQNTVAGGVRFNRAILFDPVEPFALADEPSMSTGGAGFADDEGDTVGGMLAEEYTFDPPFALESSDDDGYGLGAGTEDPLVGGILAD